MLGLAIEPLDQIAQQLANLPPSSAAPRNNNTNNNISNSLLPAADATLLAERIVKHLFNYLSGFAGGSALTPDVAVPIGTIIRWYESFVSKVKNSGVGFLENQES